MTQFPLSSSPFPKRDIMPSPSPLFMEEWLTVAEVAETLKVTPRAVRSWIKEGRLKAVKIGRIIRIKKEDLDTLLK